MEALAVQRPAGGTMLGTGICGCIADACPGRGAEKALLAAAGATDIGGT